MCSQLGEILARVLSRNFSASVAGIIVSYWRTTNGHALPNVQPRTVQELDIDHTALACGVNGNIWVGRSSSEVTVYNSDVDWKCRLPPLLNSGKEKMICVAIAFDYTNRQVVFATEHALVFDAFDQDRWTDPAKKRRIVERAFWQISGLAVVETSQKGTRLLVSHERGDVVVHDHCGEYLTTITQLNHSRLHFRRPTDIAVGFTEVFIVDSGYDGIQVLDKTFKHLRTIGGFGHRPVQFNRPESVALDHDGNLLVVDLDNQRVQVLKTDGTFITEFGCNITKSAKSLEYIEDTPRQIVSRTIRVDVNGRVLICNRDRRLTILSF